MMSRMSSKEPKACSSKSLAPVEHPLLNEDILENVFRYIITQSAPEEDVSKDVKNFRQVCLAWKNASTRLYRRTPKAMVTFGSFGRINSDRLNMHDKMQSFMDTMEQSKMIPIQRYSFIGDFLFASSFQPMTQEFLRRFGPHTASLNFHCYDVDDSMTEAFNLKSFPNLDLSSLNTLDFTFDSLRRDSTSNPGAAYFLGSLLNASYKLEEFNLKIVVTFTKSAHRNGLIKQFDEIVCPRIPKTVKVLRLKTIISKSTLKALGATGLNLKEFEFGTSSISANDPYQEFFESQAATLKILRITGLMTLNAAISTPAPIAVPQLKELSCLELWDNNVVPFQFAETFPKLRVLDIGKWGGEKNACLKLFSYAEKNPAVSVEEIHMPDFWAAPLISMIPQYFPNTKVIHIGPSPDIFETLAEVFLNLKNLEELYITFPRDVKANADAIFSGLCKHQCEEIRRAPNFDDVNLNMRGLQWIHQASILKLTKLRKLVLVMSDLSWDRVVLTDFAAHFLFLKMKNLKELSFSESQISPKYIGLLQQKLMLKTGY